MTSVLKAAVAAISLAAASLPALAQERANTILVLDASGSMWGQIDGVNKITIAREVVAGILADFPDDQNLGLVAYGHRQRGQCSDIQTMVEPAPGTAPEIIKIVNELNPRGMTPMTDAVIAAAKALRHTEQAATVILISDGIETCHADPCTAARELAQAGIDFTTHVIGFDVRGEAEALMQMQCIAEETGGLFLTADNAQELTEALQQVVAAPATGSFTFTAHVGDVDGNEKPVWDWQISTQALPLVPGEVLWEIADNERNFVREGAGNPFTADLPYGEYVVTVRSLADDTSAQVQNMFGPDSIREAHVIFPPALPPAAEVTMIAVMGSENGERVETPVTWTFSIDGESLELEGNPGVIELHPGAWQASGYHAVLEREQSVQLIVAEGQPQTHVMVFETPLPQASVSAPRQVVVGSEFAVTWVADGLNPRDYVTIVPMGAEDGQYGDYTRLSDNTEGNLRAPSEPGLYEVRLQMTSEGRVLARTPVEVVDIPVSVSAPQQVVVGSEFKVAWVAEGLNPRDYVTIVPMGAEDGQYGDYTRLSDNTEGNLRAPSEPGLYEVRLQMEGSGRVLARTQVEIIEGDVALSGPQQVRAGGDMVVEWTGTIHPRDYITIVPAGTEDGTYGDYFRVSDDSRAHMTVPDEAGLYELRYMLEGYNRVMARHPLEVVAANAPMDEGAGLSVPGAAGIGEVITVTWTGGGTGGDERIALARKDQPDFSWIVAVEAGEEKTVSITLPDEPGLYEVRFLDIAAPAVLGRSVVEVK